MFWAEEKLAFDISFVSAEMHASSGENRDLHSVAESGIGHGENTLGNSVYGMIQTCKSDCDFCCAPTAIAENMAREEKISFLAISRPSIARLKAPGKRIGMSYRFFAGDDFRLELLLSDGRSTTIHHQGES